MKFIILSLVLIAVPAIGGYLIYLGDKDNRNDS